MGSCSSCLGPKNKNYKKWSDDDHLIEDDLPICEIVDTKDKNAGKAEPTVNENPPELKNKISNSTKKQILKNEIKKKLAGISESDMHFMDKVEKEESDCDDSEEYDEDTYAASVLSQMYKQKLPQNYNTSASFQSTHPTLEPLFSHSLSQRYLPSPFAPRPPPPPYTAHLNLPPCHPLSSNSKLPQSHNSSDLQSFKNSMPRNIPLNLGNNHTPFYALCPKIDAKSFSFGPVSSYNDVLNTRREIGKNDYSFGSGYGAEIYKSEAKTEANPHCSCPIKMTVAQAKNLTPALLAELSRKHRESHPHAAARNASPLSTECQKPIMGPGWFSKSTYIDDNERMTQPPPKYYNPISQLSSISQQSLPQQNLMPSDTEKYFGDKSQDNKKTNSANSVEIPSSLFRDDARPMTGLIADNMFKDPWLNLLDSGEACKYQNYQGSQGHPNVHGEAPRHI